MQKWTPVKIQTAPQRPPHTLAVLLYIGKHWWGVLLSISPASILHDYCSSFSKLLCSESIDLRIEEDHLKTCFFLGWLAARPLFARALFPHQSLSKQFLTIQLLWGDTHCICVLLSANRNVSEMVWGRHGSSVQEEEDPNVMLTVLHWYEYCTYLSTTALSTKQQKAIYRQGENIMDTLRAIGHYTNFVVSCQGQVCCLVHLIQTFALTHEIPPRNVWALTRLQWPSVITVPSER